MKSLVCGQWTRWQTAGRLERKTNAGHRDETYGFFGRDQVDVCVHGLAEIISTSGPTACRRSARGVLISIDRAEQLLAPLLILFQICIKFHPDLILDRLFRARMLLRSFNALRF